VCLAVQGVCYVVLLYSRDIYLTIGMQFICGVLTAGRLSVAYVYMAEFLTPEFAFMTAIIYNFTDGSTFLWMTFYFDWVDKHYFPVACVGLVYTIISFLGTTFFIPESPLFLLKSGETARGKAILKSIAKFNKLDAEDLIENIAA
jgi:MFS transporter, putative metabolite:H+ symporter